MDLQLKGQTAVVVGGARGIGRAIAAAFAAEGAWLWHLKQWIDRRWMRGYLELPEMDVADAEMRCGGCAAKVPADVLGRAMARLTPAAGGAVQPAGQRTLPGRAVRRLRAGALQRWPPAVSPSSS